MIEKFFRAYTNGTSNFILWRIIENGTEMYDYKGNYLKFARLHNIHNMEVEEIYGVMKSVEDVYYEANIFLEMDYFEVEIKEES